MRVLMAMFDTGSNRRIALIFLIFDFSYLDYLHGRKRLSKT